MSKIAIHIEEELPGYKRLKDKLRANKSIVLVEKNDAEIALKYAHSSNRDLQPLEDCILKSESDMHTKMLFFSWFDFSSPNQSYFFRNYIGLWAKSNFEILQLPYNYVNIGNAIENLNLNNYAK